LEYVKASSRPVQAQTGGGAALDWEGRSAPLSDRFTPGRKKKLVPTVLDVELVWLLHVIKYLLSLWK